jgi:hypothetical protein
MHLIDLVKKNPHECRLSPDGGDGFEGYAPGGPWGARRGAPGAMRPGGPRYGWALAAVVGFAQDQPSIGRPLSLA